MGNPKLLDTRRTAAYSLTLQPRLSLIVSHDEFPERECHSDRTTARIRFIPSIVVDTRGSLRKECVADIIAAVRENRYTAHVLLSGHLLDATCSVLRSPRSER